MNGIHQHGIGAIAWGSSMPTAFLNAPRSHREALQRVLRARVGKDHERVRRGKDAGRRGFPHWRTKGGPHYEEDFAKAYERAKIKQYSWWIRRGWDHIMDGKDFNTPLLGLYMANMFGWRSAASKDDAVMEELREIKEHLGIADHT